MELNKVEPKEVVCRQSSIACAVSCKRKWWCQYRMGIVLRGGEFKEAAELGTIYHRLQLKGPDNVAEVRSWVSEKQTKLMARVQKGEDLDGELVRLASAMTSLFNRAKAMAEVFWEKYPQPKNFTVIGAEIKHRMMFEGLVLEGIIDKLLRNEQDLAAWIRDHKSTGRGLDSLFGGLAWSLQGRVYRILAEDILRDGQWVVSDKPQVKGFILDGIMMPGIKLCKTDEKNAKEWNVSVEDAYLRRVKEWYRDYEVKANLEGKKRDKALFSVAMLFSEPIFPPELKAVFDMMRELAHRPVDQPALFERDVTRMACYQWGKQCLYHDLCSKDPKQWDELFEGKYKFSAADDEGDEKAEPEEEE